MWPELISAGASLLGGIFGKPKTKSARENTLDGIFGQAQGAREAGEQYGFNPLTLLGVSSALGPSETSNYMGNAIADAGMMLAEGLAKRQDQATAKSELEYENAKLREEVQRLTLRPRHGGIYAQREAVPSAIEVLGTSNASRPQARPTHANTPRAPVISMNGQTYMAPQSLAELNEWENFQFIGGKKKKTSSANSATLEPLAPPFSAPVIRT